MADPSAPRSADTRTQSRSGAIFTTLREAVRGSHGDFTEGPIGRAVILLAVPMVLEMALESVFAVVDVFWVSKLGAGAVATVGLTESMLALLYALAIGLSIAATATVARRIGERDRERAARTAVQAIALGVCVSVPLGVLGALLAPRLLALMGASSGRRGVGLEIHRRHARRQHRHRAPLPHQRDLPGRGRRGDRDARPLARERDQPRARPVSHLRLGSVPGARRHGRGRRDDDGPRPRGRAFSS